MAVFVRRRVPAQCTIALRTAPPIRLELAQAHQAHSAGQRKTRRNPAEVVALKLNWPGSNRQSLAPPETGPVIAPRPFLTAGVQRTNQPQPFARLHQPFRRRNGPGIGPASARFSMKLGHDAHGNLHHTLEPILIPTGQATRFNSSRVAILFLHEMFKDRARLSGAADHSEKEEWLSNPGFENQRVVAVPPGHNQSEARLFRRLQGQQLVPRGDLQGNVFRKKPVIGQRRTIVEHRQRQKSSCQASGAPACAIWPAPATHSGQGGPRFPDTPNPRRGGGRLPRAQARHGKIFGSRPNPKPVFAPPVRSKNQLRHFVRWGR